MDEKKTESIKNCLSFIVGVQNSLLTETEKEAFMEGHVVGYLEKLTQILKGENVELDDGLKYATNSRFYSKIIADIYTKNDLTKDVVEDLMISIRNAHGFSYEESNLRSFKNLGKDSIYISEIDQTQPHLIVKAQDTITNPHVVEHKGFYLPIKDTDAPFRIGFSDENNDISICHIYGGHVDNTAQMSRKHSEITLEDGVHIIHDMGSRTGTYVNNQRIVDEKKSGSKQLYDGDIVNFIPIDNNFLVKMQYVKGK